MRPNASGTATRTDELDADPLGQRVVAKVMRRIIPVMVGLVIAAAGTWGTLGPFWALPAELLAGTAAAAGIALVNSIGNLGGGFIGNYVTGSLVTEQGYRKGLYVAAAVLVAGAALTLAIKRRRSETGAGPL